MYSIYRSETCCFLESINDIAEVVGGDLEGSLPEACLRLQVQPHGRPVFSAWVAPGDTAKLLQVSVCEHVVLLGTALQVAQILKTAA